MTNNKIYVINDVAARLYEEEYKIFIEWWIKTDSQSQVFYKLDNPEEIQKMSLLIQNAAIQLQKKVDKDFFGKVQENRFN